MKTKFIGAAFITLLPTVSLAGEAENILACIRAVDEFADQSVDEFDVRYTGRIIDFSTAEWPNVVCEVKLGSVYNLTVNGTQHIVEGFAGIEAKAAYSALELETEDAVSLLESRIAILERRLSDAKSNLQQPSPNIMEIENYVREGIARSTNN